VGVVKIVGRADAHVVNPLLLGSAAELVEVAIEALDLGEEPDVKCILVEQARRIVRVCGRDEPMAGVANGPQMRGATNPATPVMAKFIVVLPCEAYSRASPPRRSSPRCDGKSRRRPAISQCRGRTRAAGIHVRARKKKVSRSIFTIRRPASCSAWASVRSVKKCTWSVVRPIDG